MKTVLIKPLSNLVIRTDNLNPDQPYVLDKLNPDLSFKKTIANSETAESLEQAKREFILSNKAKPGGWVEVEQAYTMQEMVKRAMKQLQKQVRQTA